MQVGDAAAWVAAGIAVIAAFIALGNANSAKRQATAAEKALVEARRSARAAEEQAEEARKSREATERQAAAAEAAEAARQRAEDEADGPAFAFRRNSIHDQSTDILVAITLRNGANLWSVTASVMPPGTGIAKDREAPELGEVTWGPMKNGDCQLVNVGFGVRDLPDSVTLRLLCEELGGKQRQWTHTYRLGDMDKAIF